MKVFSTAALALVALSSYTSTVVAGDVPSAEHASSMRRLLKKALPTLPLNTSHVFAGALAPVKNVLGPAGGVIMMSSPLHLLPVKQTGVVHSLARREAHAKATHPVRAKATLTPAQNTLQTSALKSINAIRKKHSAKPLKTAVDLVQTAQKYAEQCVFQHSDGAKNGTYGEILAATGGDHGKATIDTVVGFWNAEGKKYNLKDPFNANTRHFTQLVWRGSSELGCAETKQCNHGKKNIFVPGLNDTQYFVCLFRKPGNIHSKKAFLDNVKP